jgi:hypothetical protein
LCSANLRTWVPPTSTAAAIASTRSAIGPLPSSANSVSCPSRATPRPWKNCSAETLSAYPPGIPKPDGRIGRHPRGDRIPVGNDQIAFRTCTGWREQRHVSPPGHDLGRAQRCDDPADSCQLPGRDVP